MNVADQIQRAHEERITATRRIHLHLGVVTGLGMALDAIREAGLSPGHPARKAIFAKLMEVNEGNVHEIVSKRHQPEEEP